MRTMIEADIQPTGPERRWIVPVEWEDIVFSRGAVAVTATSATDAKQRVKAGDIDDHLYSKVVYEEAAPGGGVAPDPDEEPHEA